MPSPLIVITDAGLTGGRPVIDVVAAAVDGGARTILVRDKDRGAHERRTLAAAVRALLEPVGGMLLVSSDPSIPADGLHLGAADRWPHPAPALVGRSCHSPAAVEAAAAEGCDYAFLSPIYPTASKPAYGPALGTGVLDGLAVPVWALGGITSAAAAEECISAGASGVAVMGAVMGADDPARMVTKLLSATPGG